MKRGLLQIASLFVLLLPSLARPQTATPSGTLDAASLPAPKWVEMFDQGRADPRLKGIQTPRAVKVEIVADGSLLKRPIAMTFDDEGMLHVLDGNELKTLHDQNGDGSYDFSKVVVNNLALSTPLLVYDGWIYYTRRGRVLRHKAHNDELLKASQAAAAAQEGPPAEMTRERQWV